MLASIIRVMAAFSLASCSLLFTGPKERSESDRWQDLGSKIPGLIAPVEVIWNQHKVPHIFAENERDLAKTTGYLHAYLRLGQISLFRMISSGRTSEMVGPFARDLDQTLRTLQLDRAVDQIIKTLPKESREFAESYLSGINSYLEFFKTREINPVEAEVLDIPLEPWSLKELFTFWRLASLDINWGVLLQHLKLKKAKRWEVLWNDLLKLNSFPMAEKENETVQSLMPLLFHGTKSGSNSLVIAPEKSETGSALIANDPHLGIAQPNIWMLMGMHTPKLDVVGMMIPGTPFIALGRNRFLSWGGTNMRAMTSFLYELSEKEMQHLESKTETIKVRSWMDRTFTKRFSKFGPLISDAPMIETEKNLALYWVGHEPSDELTAFLKANHAKNADEFHEAYASYGVSSQNMLYATEDGDIGHLLALKKPVRLYPDRREHLTTPDNPVVKKIPSHELGSRRNPTEGFLVSANNNNSEFEDVGWFFSSDDRAERMKQILSEKEKLSIQDLKNLHLDTYSEMSKEFYLALKKAPLKKKAKKVIDEIDGWDYRYDQNSRQAVIFELMMISLSELVLTERYQDEELIQNAMGQSMMKELVLSLLSQMEGEEMVALTEKAARDVLKIAANYPSWGDFRKIKVQHLLGNIPIIGSRYVTDILPADGNSNTLQKRAAKREKELSYVYYGQNARHISDLSDDNANWFILFGGNDGWAFNPHYTDQLKKWSAGEYIHLPLDREQIESLSYKKTKFSPGEK